jgi:hypothetical protein
VSASAYVFEATVWEHDGAGSWHFVSLPEPEADEIDELHGHNAKGFGSLRVQVTIGKTTWLTSIFPDTKRCTYVLPVKKAVRAAEGLSDGTVTRVQIEVLT